VIFAAGVLEHELVELAGCEAEWYFVPVQAGTFELQCTIPGHAVAGMTGKLTVE
jgi:uncharacterized cupredoxin-like copper-binding protein